MKYKLAVFDMDGTILDTITDLANAANYALRNAGHPERTTDEVRRFIGNGVKVLMKRCLAPEEDPKVYDKCLYDFLMFYDVHYNDNTCPYDGIIELLHRLRAAGVKTAVVSNKNDKAVQALVEEQFKGCFDFVLGVTEDRPVKPAPDMCEYVLSKMEFTKENACYIGDTEVDMQTAANAGLDMIGVNWGFRGGDALRALGCETLADRPSEIYDIVVGK